MHALFSSLFLSAAIALAAVPKASAEVTCDRADFGPDVRYAANIPNASDFVDTVLARGAELGPAQVLVILDVDNTLLTMRDDLGSDQWYRWQKGLLNKPGPDEGEVAADFDGMLEVQKLLFAAKAMRPTQEDTAEIVGTLQDLGYPVMALTARGPENIGATLRELTRNGIDMTRTAPAGLPDMGGAHLPFDAANPAEAGLTAEEVGAYGLEVPRPVLYRDGVFMVAGQHKGALLEILLRRIGKHYPAIAYLDDHGKHACEMAQAFQDQPVVLDAFRYDHERVQAQSFLQDPVRQAAATRDWKLLTSRMAVVCASVPEACGLPAAIAAGAESEQPAAPPGLADVPDRPLRITTWNLEHMMSEAVFDRWAQACAPHDWDEDAARAAGKPVTLTYCNAHSGLDWPCGDRREALPLRTPEAFEKKVAALRARAAELNADIYAFQEVSDAEAIARLLPPDAYEIFFEPFDVAMNVGFAVRKELAPGVRVRQMEALAICALEDRTDPADPASCIPGSYRTRPGLELTLTAGDRTLALLDVHLKSSCRGHPVSDPPLATLNARACEAADFDRAQATAEYRESVRKGCALLRDQVPVVEAWVEAQARAGHAFMVLGDFNRDFGRELRNRMPARLDGTDPKAEILPGNEIGSILKEISDNEPDGTFLYLVRQTIDGRDRQCRSADGETYRVQSCHRGIDHFLIGKHWAEAVSDNPRGIRSQGQDYGDQGYCAENARPSDHCPVTLKIAFPESLLPQAAAPVPPVASERPEPAPVTTAPTEPVPPADLTGGDLRVWLKANWYDGRHGTLGYNAARRAMYSMIDVAADGRVYGVYSGFSQPAADVTFLDPINAEHTVPQSWFGRGDPMRSDIHHLFPTHKKVNEARGSDPFGEIEDTATAKWYGLREDGRLAELEALPPGDRDAFSEDTRNEFEPREGHEGDLARAVFYFYTMYPGRAGPIARIAEDGIDTLYRWHLQDPPDAWEIQRNQRISEIQKNRNPYVDHPDLVCRAWGFDCP